MTVATDQPLLRSSVRARGAATPERVSPVVIVKRTATAIIPIPIGAIGTTTTSII